MDNEKLKDLVLYGHWVNCIKEKCGEGYNDKCHVPGGQSDYPQDGQCYNDFYKPIDEIDDSEIGALETIGQKFDPADIPF